jgi:ATP-binding cassette subfamily B protein
LSKDLASIIPYIRRHKRALLSGILALLLASCCSATVPYLIKYGVDNLQAGARRSMMQIVLLTALVAILQAGLKYLSRTKILNCSREVEFEMRRDFFSHLASLPYSFFRSQHRGDLITRMMNDVGNVRMMVGMGILHFSATIATTTLSLAMMLRLSPTITLLAIIPLSLLFFFIKYSMTRLHTIFVESQEAYGHLAKGVNEALGGIRVIKNYLLHEKEQTRFEGLNQVYMEKNMAATRIWGMVFPSIGFLGGVGTLIVMWAGGYALMEKRITLGDFIALNTYYVMLMWPIAALGWILNVYQRGVASLKRIDTIYQSPVEDEKGIPFEGLKDCLAFDRVGLVKEERTVLHDLTLLVRPREKVLIVGPTGSGKSTLLNLFTAMEEDYTGTISIDTRDLRGFSRPSLRKAIAVVPQDPFLYSQSIRENMLSPEDPDRLIKVVHMQDEIERFKDRLDVVVGERGITLSGGQKQRITLARALAVRPDILLLDDPFTHVDQLTEEAIWDEMWPLIKDVTVFMTSTRPVPLGRFDRVVVMGEGTIMDEGRPEDVLARDPYMKLLYRVRASGA